MPDYYVKSWRRKQFMRRSFARAIKAIDNAVYHLKNADEYYKTSYGVYNPDFRHMALVLMTIKAAYEKILEEIK